MERILAVDNLLLTTNLLFDLLDDYAHPTMIFNAGGNHLLYHNRAAAVLLGNEATSSLLTQLAGSLTTAFTFAGGEIRLIVHLQRGRQQADIGDWLFQASYLEHSPLDEGGCWLVRLQPATDGDQRGEHLIQRYGLTQREAEVVLLAADGLSNAAIAARLSLSQQTVAVHLRNTFLKLNIHRRSALAPIIGAGLPMAQGTASML